jgi:hypothetical protein
VGRDEGQPSTTLDGFRASVRSSLAGARCDAPEAVSRR